MPSGRTHDLITVVSGAALAPAALSLPLPEAGPANSGILLLSYLVSGLLFSPDLDLRSGPYRRWRALRWVWLPYQWFVPHRSWLSHSFFFGPLLRVLYFLAAVAFVAAGVLIALRLLIPLDPSGAISDALTAAASWIRQNPAPICYVLAGFILGGAAHTVADFFWSGLKRRF